MGDSALIASPEIVPKPDSLVSNLSFEINALQQEIESLKTILAVPEKQTESSSLWLYLITAIALALAFVSSFISFYLYKWRKILLNEEQVFQPEDWVSDVRKVNKSLNELTEKIVGGFKFINRELSTNTQSLESMKEMYISLHEALDEKDKEIQRYKKGYDSVIFKKFVFRFIRVEQALVDIINQEESITETDVKIVERLLEDALLECGVERFIPELGTDSRIIDGLDPIAERVETKNPDEEFKVAEVIKPGYQILEGVTYDIIQPARVKIYELKNTN
ncbi:MAG: hypothetical protein ROO71_10155 [Balneola sp.]